MYAYGVVHIGTIDFAQLGIRDVSFQFVNVLHSWYNI